MQSSLSLGQQQLSKFDEKKPWDFVLLMAAEDWDFWHDQVADKVTRLVNHMNKIGDLVDEGHHAHLASDQPNIAASVGAPGAQGLAARSVKPRGGDKQHRGMKCNA